LSIFLRHAEATGFCVQNELLLHGREPNGKAGTGKAEAAKLQDAGINLKAVPRKISGRKSLAY
jgi:hypothetical protein